MRRLHAATAWFRDAAPVGREFGAEYGPEALAVLEGLPVVWRTGGSGGASLLNTPAPIARP